MELDQWKVGKVYDEVDDREQEYISLRLVMNSKVIDNKLGVKAGLCACGFEEEQNHQTDSPTCSKEGLRCVSSLIASKKWPNFLQGKSLEKNVLYVHLKKDTQLKFGNYTNACMD